MMPHPVLLFDGTCPGCSRAVRFILKHEQRNDLKFSPLAGPFAEDFFRHHPAVRPIDSIVFIEENRIFVRSDAVRRTLSYLGGWWKAGLLLWIIPKPVLDRLYDIAAARRYSLFGWQCECALPINESLSRFIV